MDIVVHELKEDKVRLKLIPSKQITSAVDLVEVDSTGSLISGGMILRIQNGGIYFHSEYRGKLPSNCGVVLKV